MTRPINASLYVNEFSATGTPGEYTIVGALFNNQADATNNGAGDVAVGFVLYVPALDLNQGTTVPGVFHRFKFTAVSAADASTLSGTLLWDEDGPEQDAPAGSSFCMLAQVTPGHGFSLLPMDSVYPGLPLGMTSAALVMENRDRTDVIIGGVGPYAPTLIRVTGTTTDDTNTLLGPATSLGLASSATVAFTATVLGRRTDVPNQCISLRIEGSAYVNESTGLLVMSGGTLTTVLHRSNTSWYAIAKPNATLDAIDIEVLGSANVSLNWSATLSLTIL